MIDIKKIKQECPKAYGLLGNWMQDTMKRMQNLMGHGEQAELDLPPIELSDELVQGAVVWNQRQLFDFFDEQDIKIEIYKEWKYCIDHEPDEEFNSRPEAETAAFEAAFKQLEEQ